MKTIFFITVFVLSHLLSYSQSVIYKFDIKEEIAPPVWRKTKMAIEKAHEINADLILIHMNTYGGLVDAADSIRTKILNSKIPVYILIENNAASAGALIAIACDSIYMKPGSTMGAATVVNQSGEQVPDKYQSYMRKKMRATAEQTGRDPDIAEAMVDPDKTVPGVSDSGKVLTLTVKEAIEHGFCEAEISSFAEILKRSGIEEYEIKQQQLTATDKMIGWLISPAISGLLIMLIIGGIYFELQTPGVGFPLGIAIFAAILYFAPLYLEGLAENWEIVIFILGLILVGIEVFAIPGFGVAGITGIFLAMMGLTLSLVKNVGFDFSPVDGTAFVTASFTVIVSMLLSITGSILLGAKLLKSHLFRHLVLEAVQDKAEGYIGTDASEFDLVGKTGTAATDLRPAGKVEIDGDLYDATAETGYIEKGTSVKVVKYETAQLFVRKI
ncbi:MAG: serine protease [Bacteroidetes bacterium]|nr:MAG: serine protease [Bacteroidota bacterium]